MDKEYINNRIEELVKEHNAIIDTETKLDNDRREMEARRLQIIGSINELKAMKTKIEEAEANSDNENKDNKDNK